METKLEKRLQVQSTPIQRLALQHESQKLLIRLCFLLVGCRSRHELRPHRLARKALFDQQKGDDSPHSDRSSQKVDAKQGIVCR